MPRPKLPVRRSQQLAWLITIPLGVAAIAMTVPVVMADPQPVRGLIAIPVFLTLFVVANLMVLRLDIRRHTLTVSLADLPLLLSLFYLPPLLVITLRVIAAIAAPVFQRTAPARAAFNIASVAVGTAGANALVAAVGIGEVNGVRDVGYRTWLVLGGAVYLNFVITLVAVVGVVALVQGPGQIRHLTRGTVFAAVVVTTNITVALVMLLALSATAWSVVLLSGLAVVVAAAYRAYAQFVRQHKSLTEMYDLARAVGSVGQDGTLPDVLLGRVRTLLEAECATLWLPALGRYPEVLLSARADYSGLLDTTQTPETLRMLALRSRETVAASRKLGSDELRAVLRAHGAKDAIVVPLRSGNAVIGTLEVVGRLGDLNSFSTDDVRLLETVAAHASAAVENSRLVDRLRFDASHDTLTGLANRRRLLAALDEAVKARASGEVVAVMLFDVADLRRVNQSLGHPAGDKVLVEVANRLRALASPAALVARVGGDEFAVELRTPSLETAIAAAEEIRDGLRGRMDLGSLKMDVDTSVGVAVHPDHGDDPETLLRRAETATFAAKGRRGVQSFNAGLEVLSTRRLGLASDLQKALDDGEITVYFQPKVALSDRRLVGVECLARWDHPVHGSVTPEDFVAVAEHIGELGRLTGAVLREGLGRARDWARAGRTLSIAVNVAPRTLLDPDFPDVVAGLLTEYDVEPQRLTLEITERALAADAERPLPGMWSLHELGVRISIDDFGTGYSSLAYLARLPLDEIKIDQAFVQGMATDLRDRTVVGTAVDLSRQFGITVVAEGVESELTLGMLEESGCDIGQGFLFSRPLPYERLDAWLLAQAGPEPMPAGEVRWLRAVP